MYKDLQAEDKNIEFDFSNYPFNHPLFSTQNKKKLGKFKDELNGIALKEFIGLRPKCYSLLFLGCVKDNVVKTLQEREKQVGKGVRSNVLKRCLRHWHYRECHSQLSQDNSGNNNATGASVCIRQNIIKSQKHIIGSYHQRKIGLTAYDTKRWVEENNIDTLSFGHYKTTSSPATNSASGFNDN